MKNLNQVLELLEENGFENCDGVWAFWLSDNDFRKEPSNVRQFLNRVKMSELHKPLMEAEKNGLVSLVLDDSALCVNLLN